MCGDIYPEVNNCCYFYSLRVGMLFISVLAVITGALTLSIIEQNSNADYDTLRNVSGINEPDQMMTELSKIIPTGISGMSVLFMFTGMLLLLATLTNQEGYVQGFVVGTSLNVVVGFLMVVAIGLECMTKDLCTLSSMDWLSGSAFLILIVAYLFAWLYFIIVANSYAEHA